MPVILYGISNCDTVKKARRWLDEHGVAYAFHDYKKSGIDAGTLRQWAGEAGWEKLLNRAGTTFRKLSDADKQDVDEAKAIALMMAHTSMIKRPVITGAGPLLVGFDADRFAAAFG
nr:ArsC family reductase [uncultured Sphingomonas sp.]